MADAEPAALVAPTSPRSSHTQSHSQNGRDSSFPAPPVYPAFRIPEHLPRPPFIDVDGIPNFRELGGYLCSPAGVASSGVHSHILRRGFLYRCAHPTQITSAGVQTFSGTLGIKAIYDLRSATEVAKTNAAAAAAAAAATTVTNGASSAVPFSFDIKGSTRHFTPVFIGENYSPEGLARRLRWYKSGTSPDPPRADEIGPYSLGFLSAYRDISHHGVPAYTTMFRHILNTPDVPLVFHCTAGKDRTGVFAALVMKLAGVDEDIITWEYALTEPGLGAWRTLFIKRMTEHGLSAVPSSDESGSNGDARGDDDKLTREEAANICGSKAGNMRAFLKLVLEEEYGGIDAYLEQKCGFTKQEIEQLRKNLVVPVESINKSKIIKPCGIPGWTPDGGVVDKIEDSKF